MSLKVLHFDDFIGDQFLKSPAVPVSDSDVREVSRLAEQMLAELVPLRAVGLAAPQVGSHLAFFVFKVPAGETSVQGVVCNPKRSLRDEFYNPIEGCLSLPGLSLRPTRPNVLIVEVDLLEDGVLRHKQLKLSGYMAQVFDHEIDHLEGISMRERDPLPGSTDELEERRSGASPLAASGTNGP